MKTLVADIVTAVCSVVSITTGIASYAGLGACAPNWDSPLPATPVNGSPCGETGVVCPAQMCCETGEQCGAAETSCPAGQCCFVGRDEFMVKRRPHKQRPAGATTTLELLSRPVFFGDAGSYTTSDGCNTCTHVASGLSTCTAAACLSQCIPSLDIKRAKRLAWDDPSKADYQTAKWHLEDCDFDGCTYSNCSEAR